jgi:alpha-mannosidase
MSDLTIHMVGNAHLDPAWMWTWDEGMEAFLATCRAALDRIDETPDLVFTCGSAAVYRWIEEVEPALFERIRAKVESGNWCIVGGWWLQADCNLPSGEGFVRQALLGQRYFLDRFGRAARTGYSPDAFGHACGLPQLLARAGMTGYIYCRPDPTELALPQPLVEWRSADGSSVLAYRIPFHYNMYETTVPKKVDDLVAAIDGASSLVADGGGLGRFGTTWCLFYGVGNHGGGPTREQIAHILSIDADASRPRLLFSTPDAFLDDVMRHRDERAIPVWTDDLQIDAPGCYSAHSEIKRLNRASEHSLLQAERLSSMATALVGAEYPLAELERAWEHVCFNHFHDILCGVAIRETLDDAIEQYGAALSAAKHASRYAAQRLARAIDTRGDGQALVVVNPHAWGLEESVRFELWHDIEKSLWSQPVDVRLTDEEGNELPCQTGFTSGKIGRDRIAVTFPASLPALGWRTYRVHYGEKSGLDGAYPGTASDTVLENAHVRLEVDAAAGGIAMRMRDVGEVVGIGGVGLVIEDHTDTWGHGVESFDAVAGRFGEMESRLVESGPTHATIRVRTRHGSSWMQQDFRLAATARTVDVDVKIFWAEQYRMLKLAFASPIDDAVSVAEAAYAITTKVADGRERPCGTWCAIASQANGGALGLVSDAKHGFSAHALDGGTELRLSVLRSPSYATHIPHPHHPDEDLDFLDQGMQRFRYRIVPMPGGLDPALLTRTGALLCAPPVAHLESAHEALEPALPSTLEGARVTPSHVMLTVVKRSEEDDGWIVRVYEAAGTAATAVVELPLLGARWSVAIGPHEVRTYLVRSWQVDEVDLIERPV